METAITGIGAVVVAELRVSGYMESTIGQYEKSIRALTGFARRRGASIYTPALGRRFASLTTSPRTGRFSAQRRSGYRRLVALFDSYVATGRVDLSMRKRGGGGPRPAGTQFMALDASWETAMVDRGLAAATREAYGRVARGYLCYLESSGIFGLDAADGGTVLAFLASLSPRWAKASLFWVVSDSGRSWRSPAGPTWLTRPTWPAHGVRTRSCRSSTTTTCGWWSPHVDPMSCAPGTRRSPCWPLSTGLQACDIVELRVRDIDWRGRSICIVQRKTSNPLTVPLTDLLAGRLADYVLRDRPGTSDDHVFVRRVAPHVRLEGHAAIHRVTAEVFRAAGVTGVRGGTRLLRHNVASRMLRAATPLPTISAVLGHAGEESTKQYMSIDDDRLLGCVLPVPEGARR
jgi:Phage integrase family